MSFRKANQLTSKDLLYCYEMQRNAHAHEHAQEAHWTCLKLTDFCISRNTKASERKSKSALTPLLSPTTCSSTLYDVRYSCSRLGFLFCPRSCPQEPNTVFDFSPGLNCVPLARFAFLIMSGTSLFPSWSFVRLSCLLFFSLFSLSSSRACMACTKETCTWTEFVIFARSPWPLELLSRCQNVLFTRAMHFFERRGPSDIHILGWIRPVEHTKQTLRPFFFRIISLYFALGYLYAMFAGTTRVYDS